MSDTSPHGFLLYLRGLRPDLARRLEAFRSLGLTDSVLKLKMNTSGWPGMELLELGEELEAAVKTFFGDGVSLSIEPGELDRERLPFPIASTKYWNHVAFIDSLRGVTTALTMPKPVYAKLSAEESDASALEDNPDVLIRRAGAGASPHTVANGSPHTVVNALYHFIDPLANLARQKSSYVHFLTPFPGDVCATALEARLYSIKEWGTPDTPYAIARKYLGRLHYCDPDSPPLGIRLARSLSGR